MRPESALPGSVADRPFPEVSGVVRRAGVPLAASSEVVPLRVCMLVTYDLASPGGVKQHAMQLAAALRERGDHVTIVGPSSKPIDDPHIKTFRGVINVPSNGSDNMLGIFAWPPSIASFFARNRFDVIHVHEPLNPSLAYWTTWMTTGTPRVATFHAYAEHEGAVLRWWRKVAGLSQFRWYQRAIAVSDPAARHAAHAWRGPLSIIPNGVPSDVFVPAPQSKDLPIKLLFVGRIGDARKGARYLYEAYAGLVAREMPVTLDMVGELGDAEPPPELPGLRYHGAVDSERLIELYRACDVFVAPSTGQESFGIVLLEAMASGKPVVCSDIDGYRQVAVRDGATFVPPCDSQALEAALAQVIELEPAERARQGEINRRVATEYDWNRIAERVRGEYLAVVEEARRDSGSTLDAPDEPQVRAPVPVPARSYASLLLALCFALRIVSLFRPCLSDDEAIYAVVGREMLAGRALYKDVVDHKPPAIYVVYETVQGIAGPIGGMILLHALLIIVVWATAMSIARIVRRFDRTVDERGPPLAALLWIVFTTTLVDADSLAANCELFMMLPLVWSVEVFLAARDRLSWLVGAGALVGAAMLFKYQAGIQLPLYASAWVVTRRRMPARAAAGVAAIGAGAMLPIAAAALVFVLHGSLDAAWFWFRFNFAYIHEGSRDWGQMLVRGGFVVIAALPLYWLAVRAIARRRGEPFGAFVFGWLAVSGAAVLIGGRFFGHYFHQVTAPLAVLAAPAAVAAWQRRRSWFTTALAVPAAAFLALGFAHERVMAAAGEPDPDYTAVASWIRAHAATGDALCVWGNSPVLYFAADRPLGCRFVFSNYLTGMSPATATQTDADVDSSANIVPAAWDMLEADLSTRHPTWLVDGSPGDVAHYGKYPPAKFPRLARVIACEYAPVADVAGMRIYRRLDAPRCSSTAFAP